MEIRIIVSRAEGAGLETPEQRQALIEALEFLFGQRNEAKFGEVTGVKADGPLFGWQADSVMLHAPSPGYAEWKRVALDKWKHFKAMVEEYERAAMESGRIGPSSVAIDTHLWQLVKMIPYLMGTPELALEEFPQQTLRDKVRARVEEKQFRQETMQRRAEESKAAHAPRPGDPHHHEERLPAYPKEHLDFASRLEDAGTMYGEEEPLTEGRYDMGGGPPVDITPHAVRPRDFVVSHDERVRRILGVPDDHLDSRTD